MEPIRYRAGEAIRWLETGAESSRKSAKQKGRELFVPGSTAGAKLGQGVGALIDFGKSAWTEVVHKQAEAAEYVLQDDRFDIVSGNSIKSVLYADVRRMVLKGEKATMTLQKGSLIHIKPYAHIVAGRVRVPVGWMRNGMEVPYDLLIEELAARCGVELEAA